MNVLLEHYLNVNKTTVAKFIVYPRNPFMGKLTKKSVDVTAGIVCYPFCSGGEKTTGSIFSPGE